MDAELIRLKKQDNNIMHRRKFIHTLFCDAIIIMQMNESTSAIYLANCTRLQMLILPNATMPSVFNNYLFTVLPISEKTIARRQR